MPAALRTGKPATLITLAHRPAALILLVALTIPSLPDAWTQDVHIGPFFVAGSIWGLASVLAVGLLALQVRQGLVATLSWISLVLMAGAGALASFSSRYGSGALLYDIFIFAGLPVGVSWAVCAKRSESSLFLLALYWCNWAMLAATNVLLASHRLEPAWPGPRVFVYPEFLCTWTICVITPFVFFDSNHRSRVSKTIARLSPAATILILSVTAIISGTRSVAIQLAVSFLFTFWGILRYRSLNVKWLVAGVAGLCVVIGLSMAAVSKASSESGGNFGLSLLRNRFSATQVENEERVSELRALGAEYGTDLLIGRGLGSQFASVTFSKGGNIGVAPHIAIVTLLMKGGAMAFLLGIVAPLLWAAKSILSAKDIQLFAACAGILMYVVFSSISGGWNFPNLFLYGFFLSYAIKLRQRRRRDFALHCRKACHAQ